MPVLSVWTVLGVIAGFGVYIAVFGFLFERLVGVARWQTAGTVLTAVSLWLLVPLHLGAWLLYKEGGGDTAGLIILLGFWPYFWLAGLLFALPRIEELRVRENAINFAGIMLHIAVYAVAAAIWERDALTVGIVSGAILALGAMGLTLVFGVLKFANFAHGDQMMLSAFFAFLLLTGIVAGERTGSDTTILPVTINDLPGAESDIWKFSFGYGLPIAIVLTAAVTGVFSAGIDRLVYQRLRARGSGIVIFAIASLGLAFMLRSLILLVWGPNNRLYYPGIRTRVDLVFGVDVLADQLFILAAALVVTALAYVLLFRTRLGKAMRAMADNPDLARVSGINTDRIITATWLIAGFMTATAGILLALQAQLSSELGFILLLPLFAAAIVGGLGNPQGALVGGLVVGIVQEVAVTFDFLSPGYKFSVAFVVLILMLIVRPRGLFGEQS